MRAQFVIPVLASVLILGTLGMSQTVYAPPAAEAALILAIVTTSYIPETQEFEVELSIHCGIAKAGQKADFTIETELVIEPSSGSPEVFLVGSKVKDVIRSASCNASGDELGRIKVQFPWDRNGGTVEGPVNVGVEAKILNPAGKAIGNGGDSEEFVVEVGPPEPEGKTLRIIASDEAGNRIDGATCLVRILPDVGAIIEITNSEGVIEINFSSEVTHITNVFCNKEGVGSTESFCTILLPEGITIVERVLLVVVPPPSGCF